MYLIFRCYSRIGAIEPTAQTPVRQAPGRHVRSSALDPSAPTPSRIQLKIRSFIKTNVCPTKERMRTFNSSERYLTSQTGAHEPCSSRRRNARRGNDMEGSQVPQRILRQPVSS